MWVVVGLGNPGKKYAHSRHNVGFIFLQRLADKHSARWKKRNFEAKTVKVDLANGPALLVKPWTYMNRSGVAVQGLLERTGVSLDRLLLVYDDLDIPLGEIRIRQRGGPGTHKGMASIVHEIETSSFPRMRIGIGPLPPDVDATDFVLDDFGREDAHILEECLTTAEEAIDLIMLSGVNDAMNKYNRRPAPPQRQPAPPQQLGKKKGEG